MTSHVFWLSPRFTYENSGDEIVVSGAGQEYRVPLSSYERCLARYRMPIWLSKAEYEAERAELEPWVERGVLARLDPRRTPFNAITTLRNDRCDQLFLVYQGAAMRLMLPAATFLRDAGLGDRNVVLLRDLSRRFYTSGVSPEIDSFPALLAWQRGYMEALPAPGEIYCIGTSMGAWAAIRAGYYLRARTVWAFAPERLSYEAAQADGLEPDLRRLLRDGNGVTQYRILYNESSASDREVAGALASMPGVELLPQQGEGHLVVDSLHREDELRQLFPPLSERGTSSAPRVPGDQAVITDRLTSFVDARRVGPVDRSALACAALEDLLDSFGMVELHAYIEETWRPPTMPALEEIHGCTIATLAARLAARPAASGPSPGRAIVDEPSPRATMIGAGEPATTRSEVVIDLSHTGPNNLSEARLLELVGDIQWRQIAACAGRPASRLVDAEGRRILPTFFHVELAFPAAAPMGSLGEGDRLSIRSGLRRYGTSILLGRHVIMPVNGAGTGPPSATDEPGGHAFVQLDITFSRRAGRGVDFEPAAVADPGVLALEALTDAPDCVALARARDGDRIQQVPPDYAALPAAGGRATYRVVPERDINAAGLLYFARYPSILDVCEREVLLRGELAGVLSAPALLAATLDWRRSLYFANAAWDDDVEVEVEVWRRRSSAAQDAGAALFLRHRMTRHSDGTLMMLSAARKRLRATSGEARQEQAGGEPAHR